MLFFFNDTATTEIYTLSLHDALPIYDRSPAGRAERRLDPPWGGRHTGAARRARHPGGVRPVAWRRAAARDLRRGRRSEEHTSELQSRQYLVCRLLLEKKNYNYSLQHH